MNAYHELYWKERFSLIKVEEFASSIDGAIRKRRRKMTEDEAWSKFCEVQKQYPDCYVEKIDELIWVSPNVETIADDILENNKIVWAWVEHLQLRPGYTREDLVAFLNGLKGIEYDDGYGTQQLGGMIAYSDGSWLERREYDGAEWWELKRYPAEPDWDQLDEIYKESED